MTDTPASRPAALPLGILAGIFILFFAVNPQIIADWRIYSFDDGTYSHAYLIPFMCAYLAWVGWKAGHLTPRGSWLFLGLTALALLLYQWLDIAHQRYLSRALVPACLVLATLAVFPLNRTSVATGGFFWFVTPVWGPINEFLQWSSVKAVNYIMSFTGIPTFVYEEYVEIPAGTFEIADGCSGLRYVIAALALVTFYSVMYLQRARSVGLLVAFAVGGAMLTNWLRITALILIGQYSDMQAEIISDHNMFGWWLFIPLMFLIFMLADRLERGDRGAATPAAPGGGGRIPTTVVVTLLLSLGLFSGAVLRTAIGEQAYAMTAEFDVETGTALALPVEPAPRVYAASDYAVSAEPEEDPQTISYRFSFDGSIDAERAEFYLNDPVPEGWRIVTDTLQGNARRLTVARGLNEAQITVSYEVNGTRTGDRGALRALRLAAALRLDRSSVLHWQFSRCEGACADAAAP
jgi:exosortase